MFKNFWYACELSGSITNTPTKVRLLGQDLAVFRKTDGSVAALSDLCIHRGGSLSMGPVESDCVRCPYHGWKFNSDGKCVEIPAEKSRKRLPQQARVDAYPAQERYGFVWVFMGDLPEEERPPLPEFPDYEAMPGWRSIAGTFDWNANYERVIENGIDIAHAPWVHGGSFGNPEEPEVSDYEVESDELGLSVKTVLLGQRPSRLPWGLGKPSYRKVVSTVGVRMPHITFLDLDLPGNMKMRLIDANVPVDEGKTRTLWVMARNFFPYAWADGISRKKVVQIFKEDAPFVQAQRPVQIPSNNRGELLVKSDATQMAYRKLRRRYMDKGWALPAWQQSAKESSVAIIGGPARREAGTRAFVTPEIATVPRLVPDDTQSLQSLDTEGPQAAQEPADALTG